MTYTQEQIETWLRELGAEAQGSFRHDLEVVCLNTGVIIDRM
jgi:hypothetical protein